VSRYRFRLESVLRVRRVQEERSRAELAMARLAELEAQKATARRVGLLRRMSDEGLPSGASVEWANQRARSDRMAAAVTASQVAQLHAAELSQRRLADWERAARDLRALERLDERQREEWLVEQGREEQKVLDEITPRKPR
jgi:flagellar FliJ protein